MAELPRLLREILRLIEARGADAAAASWQHSALATTRRNVASYLAGIEQAAGRADAARAAGRVSGIRKGIADLGLFPPADPVLRAADRADTLATSICAEGSSAARP